MKKSLQILFVLIWISNCVFAQQNKIDSLSALLKIAKEDTNKVNIICALNEKLMNIDPDTTIILTTQALKISEKLDYDKGLWMCYYLFGACHYLKGEFSEALSFYEKGISTCESPETADIADSSSTGRLYWKARCLNNIGLVYFNLSNYPKALEYHLQSLNLKDKIGADATADNINIANVYNAESNYKKALEYYKEGLVLAEKTNNKNNELISLGNIGVVYFKQGNYDKALEFYFKSLKIAEETGDKNQVASRLNNIGLAYSALKNNEKALEYSLDALKLAEETKNNDNKAAFLANVGAIHLEAKNYSVAEKYLLEALELSKSIGSLNYIMQTENYLSNLNEQKGKYEEALKYFKDASAIKDSLFTLDKNNAIESKVLIYEFDKKQALIKSENAAQMEKQKTRMLSFQIGGGLLIIFLLIVLWQRSARQKVEKQKALLQQRIEIRQRISSDLHDQIGAGITAISNTCFKGESDLGKGITPGAAFIERILLESRKLRECLEEIWTNDPEYNNLAGLFTKIRSFSYKFLEDLPIKFNLNLPENVVSFDTDPETNRNIFLIVKEALNNIVKHSEASEVTVNFLLEANKKFKLVIQDNGKGFDTNIQTNRNGLKNFANRTKLIQNGSYNINSGIGNGTVINIEGSLV